MTPPRTFITGATGFIGTRLVQKLIGQGHAVTCLARCGTNTSRLREAGASIALGDVTDPQTLSTALEASTPQTVFHLAGVVKAIRPRDFSPVNAQGVENIAAACAACAAPPVLILVSSLAAAGPGQNLTEDIPSNPVSAYGKSKLAGEQAARRHAARIPATIVRPPIVYGPGDQGVLQIFRPIAQWNRHFVPGCKESQYAMIYVDDLIDALILAAQKGERIPPLTDSTHSPGQGVYYVAGDEQPTYAQLGSAIAKALALRPPTITRLPNFWLTLNGILADAVSRILQKPLWISSDKMIEAKAGPWTCLSTKARTQLGWRPTATLEDHLSETAQWYRENKWL